MRREEEGSGERGGTYHLGRLIGEGIESGDGDWFEFWSDMLRVFEFLGID